MAASRRISRAGPFRMNNLKHLCTPRETVFDITKRDTVLNLSHLVDGKIDPAAFLDESYVTDGMHTLLARGVPPLQGKSEPGVFKLTQAMGGGKTHNLITLGMLAKHPELRASSARGAADGQVISPMFASSRFRAARPTSPHGLVGRNRTTTRKSSSLQETITRR